MKCYRVGMLRNQPGALRHPNGLSFKDSYSFSHFKMSPIPSMRIKSPTIPPLRTLATEMPPKKAAPTSKVLDWWFTKKKDVNLRFNLMMWKIRGIWEWSPEDFLEATHHQLDDVVNYVKVRKVHRLQGTMSDKLLLALNDQPIFNFEKQTDELDPALYQNLMTLNFFHLFTVRGHKSFSESFNWMTNTPGVEIDSDENNKKFSKLAHPSSTALKTALAEVLEQEQVDAAVKEGPPEQLAQVSDKEQEEFAQGAGIFLKLYNQHVHWEARKLLVGEGTVLREILCRRTYRVHPKKVHASCFVDVLRITVDPTKDLPGDEKFKLMNMDASQLEFADLLDRYLQDPQSGVTGGIFSWVGTLPPFFSAKELSWSFPKTPEHITTDTNKDDPDVFPKTKKWHPRWILLSCRQIFSFTRTDAIK